MATFEHELDVARRAVERAGQLTLQYFGTRYEIEYKTDASPVTIADRSAETLLRKELDAAFPDDGILGEEFPEKPSASGRRWIIDPIDGTASFIRGVPLYGVLAGLEIIGERTASSCVVGVAGFPAVGETFWAARGTGAFRNDEPTRVSAVTSLAEATIVTSDVKPLHFGDKFDGFIRLLDRAARQRGWGDCYGYALVASGRAEVMVDPLLNPWDIAALIPILEESGAAFFDWSGAPTIYGGSGIATTRGLAAEVRAALEG